MKALSIICACGAGIVMAQQSMTGSGFRDSWLMEEPPSVNRVRSTTDCNRRAPVVGTSSTPIKLAADEDQCGGVRSRNSFDPHKFDNLSRDDVDKANLGP